MRGRETPDGSKSLDSIARDTLEAHGAPSDFGHGIGHPIGLFAHDVFRMGKPLEAGMVVMIEPGVYIEDEGIGLRLENAYLVREDGCDLLTGGIPNDAEGIERMMAEAFAPPPPWHGAAPGGDRGTREEAPERPEEPSEGPPPSPPAARPGPAGRRGPDRPPNILFIYLDDFGWRDTGYMGSDFYETPHLDALARGGMVFTDAYSCAANCAPARAWLLSGQYTPRHRIFNVGTGPRGDAKHRRLLHVPGTATLPPEIVTWAEALQARRLPHRHVRQVAPRAPTRTSQGFDVAVEHGKLPGFKRHTGARTARTSPTCSPTAPSTSSRRTRDQPWCAYLAHFAVHTPLAAQEGAAGEVRGEEARQLHDHVAMATMIQAVDDGVGRILAALEELGLARATR